MLKGLSSYQLNSSGTTKLLDEPDTNNQNNKIYSKQFNKLPDYLSFWGKTNCQKTGVIYDKHFTMIEDLFAASNKIIRYKDQILNIKKTYLPAGNVMIQVYKPNMMNKPVLIAKKKINDNISKLGFMLGKSGKVAIIESNDNNHRSENLHIIMIAGSALKNNNFEVIMPEEEYQKTTPLTFTGKMIYSKAFMPDKTDQIINEFWEMEKYKEFTPQWDLNALKEVNKDVIPVLLAGGFGSRMGAALMARDDNKPALPVAHNNLRVIDFTLGNLYRSGLIDDKPDNIKIMGKTKIGSAAATIESIRSDYARNTSFSLRTDDNDTLITGNKNILLCSCDMIGDFTYNNALEDFRRKPDAGMMVVGVPLDENEIRHYGVIARDDNNVIKRFIDKPANSQEAKDAKIYRNGVDTKTYLSSASLSIISPEVARYMEELYAKKLEEFKKNNSDTSLMPEFDLGKDLIPELLRAMKNEEITKKVIKNGKMIEIPLKMYSYAVDDGNCYDVGTLISYIETSRRLASGEILDNLPETIKKGFKDNVSENGIVFMPGTKDVFNNHYSEAKGNILVMQKG